MEEKEKDKDGRVLHVRHPCCDVVKHCVQARYAYSSPRDCILPVHFRGMKVERLEQGQDCVIGGPFVCCCIINQVDRAVKQVLEIGLEEDVVTPKDRILAVVAIIGRYWEVCIRIMRIQPGEISSRFMSLRDCRSVGDGGREVLYAPFEYEFDGREIGIVSIRPDRVEVNQKDIGDGQRTIIESY